MCHIILSLLLLHTKDLSISYLKHKQTMIRFTLTFTPRYVLNSMSKQISSQWIKNKEQIYEVKGIVHTPSCIAEYLTNSFGEGGQTLSCLGVTSSSAMSNYSCPYLEHHMEGTQVSYVQSKYHTSCTFTPAMEYLTNS